MDNFALKAVYNHPEDGYYPISELEEGKEYTVSGVSMGGWYTDIWLEGFDKSFNSVNFDFFKDGKPHDIYKDPNYNPYIRRYTPSEIDFDYEAED